MLIFIQNAKDVNEMRDNAVNEIKKETESANVDAPKYKFGWRFLRQTDRADACGELSRGVYDGMHAWCPPIQLLPIANPATT